MEDLSVKIVDGLGLALTEETAFVAVCIPKDPRDKSTALTPPLANLEVCRAFKKIFEEEHKESYVSCICQLEVIESYVNPHKCQDHEL